MGFGYPVDVKDLVERVKKRGADFLEHLGLEGDERDDVALTKIVWGAGRGWFPAMADGSPHGAVDIGLPALEGDSYEGAKVVSIGDGEVIYAESAVFSDEHFDMGRAVALHKSKDGKPAYVLYQNLHKVDAVQGQKLKQGDPIGQVGWHGDFPHLHFAVASTEPLGGESELTPEGDRDSLPGGEGAWNILRLSPETIPDTDFPGLPQGKYYLFNPIEFVRWCKGDKYEHDTGATPPHPIEVTPQPSVHGLSPFAESRLEVKSLFKSDALANCASLQKLACDPEFKPLEPKSPDADAVSAIQRALKAVGYSLGKSGPQSDGIDGDFGATTTKVLKKFQAEKAKKMDLAALGRSGDEIKDDGKVDWLTLMALDAAASGIEQAPPEKKPDKPKAPAGDAPTPPRPPQKADPPPSGSYVFDPAAGPSFKFGMRMYKALLKWEWDGKNGVGYSSTVGAQYGPLIDKSLYPEWPDLSVNGIEPDKKTGGVPVFSGFGLDWKGSNYSNCCNVQMAAMLVAAGGKAFGRKDPDGTVVSYDLRDSTRGPNDTLSTAKAKLPPYPAIKCFQQTFVGGTTFYKNGQCLDLAHWGGMQSAMKYLNLGELVFDLQSGKQEKNMTELRVGDCAAYDHHAFLVGDVRYGIFFKDGKGKKTWHCVVDQSGFIDAEKPRLYKVGKGDGSVDKSPRDVDGRKLMTAQDCDWVAENEKEFDRRIRAFLASTTLEVDGVQREVEVIQPTLWRVFTANGGGGTAHAMESVLDENKQWVYKSKTVLKWAGVTRPWNGKTAKSDPICAARWYGPGK